MRTYCQSSSKPIFIKSMHQEGELIKTVAMKLFIQKLERRHITTGGK